MIYRKPRRNRRSFGAGAQGISIKGQKVASFLLGGVRIPMNALPMA